MVLVLSTTKEIADMVPICYKNVKKDLYEIDEFGNIYSKYKKDFLKPNKDKDGYLRIKLSGGSREEKCYVQIATLVAWHYIGPPPETIIDPTINHRDGNILNNHYSNLEWMSRSKNSSIRKNKGEGSQNHEAKLDEKEVFEICELLINTELSLEEIANKFSVDKTTISNIKQKKSWKKITQQYDFSCRQTIRDEKGQFKTINTRINRLN